MRLSPVSGLPLGDQLSDRWNERTWYFHCGAVKAGFNFGGSFSVSLRFVMIQ